MDGPASSSVWAALHEEALAAARREPSMAGLLATAILVHDSLERALVGQLARKLDGDDIDAVRLRDVIQQACRGDPSIAEAAGRDLAAILARDPACGGFVKPFLFFKGFLGLQAHRVAHRLLRDGRDMLAQQIRRRAAARFHMDIHPAAVIGRGVFIDHGTGIVIGQTAVVGDDVSILQGVTLGPLAEGDCHPKIGRGVLLSADAKVLGPVTVGDDAKVAAGSVVLRDVPPCCTAVGVPARLVNCPTAVAT